MLETLSPDFIRSIVIIENFTIQKNNGKISLVTINEELKDEIRILTIENIIYIKYSRWSEELSIDVIDAFLEPFNSCELVKSMHSPEREQFYVLRFHSGEHHLVIGAEKIYL